MRGAWCLALGAWCLVLGAWCLVLDAWCFGAWHCLAQIVKVSSAIADCRDLRSLHLGHNRLQTLPESLGELADLQSLR